MIDGGERMSIEVDQESEIDWKTDSFVFICVREDEERGDIHVF